MSTTPREPTAEECETCDVVLEDEHSIGHAIWYPQMGGYVGKAVVVFSKERGGSGRNPCFDVYVWHDGEWPFNEGEPPNPLHHCNAQQFIDFGREVLNLQGVDEDEE